MGAFTTTTTTPSHAFWWLPLLSCALSAVLLSLEPLVPPPLPPPPSLPSRPLLPNFAVHPCPALPAIDIAIVTATTAARLPELAARRVRPGDPRARLYLSHGSGGATPAITCLPFSEAPSVMVVAAPPCTEVPAAPPWSLRYHPFSSLSCRAMEGLCAAVAPGAPLPAYVALVSEDSRFVWPEFLRARVPPGLAQFVLTDVLEGWAWGLAKHYEKPAWPRMPMFNATTVFSGSVVRTLCALHRAAPLQLIGPLEMHLGQLLSVLDGVPWVREEQPVVKAGEGLCPPHLFAKGLDGPAWAACAAAAAAEGVEAALAAGAVMQVASRGQLGTWPFPGP